MSRIAAAMALAELALCCGWDGRPDASNGRFAPGGWPRFDGRWSPSHGKTFTARRFGLLPNMQRRHARLPTVWHARRGTSACSAFRVRHSRPPRWATPSTPGSATSKSNAWAATRTRPSRSTSCGDRRQRRSTNWNATCGAGIAHGFKGDRTSAAILSRCGRQRFPRPIRHRRGGRASDNVTDLSTSPKQVYLAGRSFLDSIQLSECCWGQPCWKVNLKSSVLKFCSNWSGRRMIPSSKDGFSL